ncbi:MAG: hypothetical protein JW981_01040 [Anaerolineae bacterium]|nr:hypothetical protein [Anaerolineae bacterium]
MFKKFVPVLLVVVLLGLGVALVSAQGGDLVTRNTSWTFQNLGSEIAQVEVGFYRTDGAMITTDSLTVTKSASFWAPEYPPLDPSGTIQLPFNGAIYARSNQPLASIVNQVASNSTSEMVGYATYMGIAEDHIAPTIYVPVLMKFFGSKYWTELNIQSASMSDTQVRVHYYHQDGMEVTGSPSIYNIPAGSPVRVAQAEEDFLPDNWNGSAIVESVDGVSPIAVVVNEFVGTPGNMYNEFYSYEGFIQGANRVVLPAVFVNGYGVDYQASTSVQNLNGPSQVADVTWRFYDTTSGNPNAGTEILSFTEKLTTSKSIYFPDAPYVQQLLDGYETGDNAWVGAIILESTQPLVAIVNELNLPYHAASYVGLTEGQDELFFPLAFVKAYGYANTSFSIADMSNGPLSPITVTVEYVADKGKCPSCSDTEDVYVFTNIDSKYQPEHLNEEFLKSALTPDGVFVGSIRITANRPINGIMNELVGDASSDNFTSFNAFVAR